MLDDSLELLHTLLLVSVGKLVEDLVTSLSLLISVVKGSLASDSSGQDEVLLHDGHSVGMDSAQVGVLEETNQVCFSCFLDSKQSLGLESDVRVNGFTDGSHESLEWSFLDEHVGGLLVSLDLSEGDCSWSESLLLHASLSRSGLLLGLAGHLALGAGTALGD